MNIRILTRKRFLPGVLLAFFRRTLRIKPKVGCIPDRGLHPFADARHCDNKNDNTEDVCQWLRMF